MPPRRLSDLQEAQLAAAYDRSGRAHTVARRFRVSLGTVYNVLQRQGVAAKRTTRRSRPLTEAQIAWAVREYRSKRLTSPQIAKELCVAPTAVRRHLHLRGVKLRTLREVGERRHLLTAEEEQLVVQRYGKTHDVRRIASEFGVKWQYVYRVLQRQGASVRKPAEYLKKCRLDETAFDQDSEAAAYFAGLLMADGHVGRPGPGNRQPQVSLDLEITDEPTVRAFAAFVGSGHKISTRERQDGSRSCRVMFRSKRMAASLHTLGVRPGKTLRAEASRSLASNVHFWRGYMDGDGGYSVATARGGYRWPHVTIVGTEGLIRQFQRFLNGTLGIAHQNKIRHVRGAWSTSVYGRKGYLFAKRIYEGSTIWMARKRRAAQRILDEFATRFE